jgi:hypothetical protein
MMIPMKSGAMAMTMVTISPLWEGISWADSYLPESFSLYGVFRPTEAAVSISEAPLHLGFWGRQYTRRSDGRSGPGWPHNRPARPGVGPRPLFVSLPCGSSRFHYWKTGHQSRLVLGFSPGCATRTNQLGLEPYYYSWLRYEPGLKSPHVAAFASTLFFWISIVI